MRNFFLLFFLLLLTELMLGQSLRYSFEPSLNIGRIFKHTTRFTAPVDGLAIGGELNTNFHTMGKHPWHQWTNYPTFGIKVSYFNFGNNKLYGSGIGFCPNVSFDFFPNSRFIAKARIGGGLSIVTRPFTLWHNPDNIGASSYLNNITSVRLGIGYKVSKHLDVILAGSLTHYSNGASTLPNLGLNVAAVNLGVRYRPNPWERTDFKRRDSLRVANKRIGVNLEYGMHFRPSSTSGGPRYPGYMINLMATRMLGRGNRLSVGVGYEFAGYIYNFMSHIELYDSENERRKNATRITFLVQDEVIWGNFSFVFVAGTYLTRSFGQAFPVFEKLGYRYYFDLGYAKAHVGLYLKAHKAIAENITYGVGISF